MPPSRASIRLGLAAALLTLAAIALAVARVPLGVASEWVTEYAPSPQWGRAWGSLAALAVVVAVCWLGMSRCAVRRWVRVAFVALLVAAAFVAHVVVACAGEFGFGEFVPAIIWQRAMGPYYREAEGLASASEYMRTLERRVQAGLQHSNTHPAGPGLLFYWARGAVHDSPRLAHALRALAWRVFDVGENVFLRAEPRSARLKKLSAFLIGLELCFAAALAVVPAYWLGSALCGEQGGALCAGLTAMLPSAMLFNPGVDQLMPALSLTVCAAAYGCGRRAAQIDGARAWRDVRLCAWGAGLGAALYVAFFFSLAFLVNIAICGACALWLLVRDWRATLRASAVVGVSSAAAFGLLSLLAWALWRYDTLGVLRAVYGQNDAFNAQAGRTYWKWLLVNPIEFILFSGCPIVALLGFGLAADVRGRPSRAVPWAACFAAVLALLWLSGKNLGEVERLWVFLMPLAAVAGVASSSRWGGVGRATALLLLALQAVQVAAFRACFDVYGAAGYFRKLLG